MLENWYFMSKIGELKIFNFLECHDDVLAIVQSATENDAVIIPFGGKLLFKKNLIFQCFCYLHYIIHLFRGQ